MRIRRSATSLIGGSFDISPMVASISYRLADQYATAWCSALAFDVTTTGQERSPCER